MTYVIRTVRIMFLLLIIKTVYISINLPLFGSGVVPIPLVTLLVFIYLNIVRLSKNN